MNLKKNMFIKFATNNLRAVVNNLKSNYKKYHRYGILTENIKGTLTQIGKSPYRLVFI